MLKICTYIFLICLIIFLMSCGNGDSCEAKYPKEYCEQIKIWNKIKCQNINENMKAKAIQKTACLGKESGGDKYSAIDLSDCRWGCRGNKYGIEFDLKCEERKYVYGLQFIFCTCDWELPEKYFVSRDEYLKYWTTCFLEE